MKKKTIAAISVAALAATTLALPVAAAGNTDNPVQLADKKACGAKKGGACGAKAGACGAKAGACGAKAGACGAKAGACGAKAGAKAGACGAKKCGAK